MGARKLPISLFRLDEQVKSPLKSPIKAPGVTLLISLCYPGVRPRDLFFLASILRSVVGRAFSIRNQRFDNIGRFRLRRSDKELIVPRLLGVRIIIADITRRRLALTDLTLPVLVHGRSALEVEVFREWKRLALVQPFLVKVVCFFEIGEVACDLGWTG